MRQQKFSSQEDPRSPTSLITVACAHRGGAQQRRHEVYRRGDGALQSRRGCPAVCCSSRCVRSPRGNSQPLGTTTRFPAFNTALLPHCFAPSRPSRRLPCASSDPGPAGLCSPASTCGCSSLLREPRDSLRNSEWRCCSAP